ncbi:MAG: TetR/AcrR family transcriptional regulator [Sedimentitalea sp.]
MTSKPRGRPRSATAHQAIVASALALLEERGLTGITIEAVAARAKVGKPTIYRYWANAQELAMAALMHQSPQISQTNGAQSDLDTLRAQLKSVIARFSTRSGKQAATLMASADPDSEVSKAFRNQVILQSRAEGRVILDQIFGNRTPTACSTDSLLDMIYGPIFYRLLTRHAPLEADLADDITNMIAALAASDANQT